MGLVLHSTQYNETRDHNLGTADYHVLNGMGIHARLCHPPNSITVIMRVTAQCDVQSGLIPLYFSVFHQSQLTCRWMVSVLSLQ